MAVRGKVFSGPAGSQPVGDAIIVQGTVRAVAADGTERLLQPGSPVYADDRIITGPEGMVSVVFADQEQTRLDLGRLSDVLVDRDVYGDALPVDQDEASGDVIVMQQALQQGEFDPTVDSEPPAAGDGGAGAGGGDHPYVVFEATAAAVTPDSGAETTGVDLDFLDPQPVDILPPEQTVASGAAAGTPHIVTVGSGDGDVGTIGSNPVPTAVPDTGEVVEAAPGAVSAAAAEGGHAVTGNLMTNDTAGDVPTRVTFIEVGGIRYSVPAGGSVTLTTELGAELTVHSDGTYSYIIDTNILHEANGRGDGIPDREIFNYTITDTNGDPASSTLTVNVLDTAPEARPDTNITVEGGSQVSGNVIFGWDDSAYVPDSEDVQSTDPGLTLVRVSGDLADDFALDTPLATIHGGTIVFGAGGSYVYTPPARVDNPAGLDDANQPVQEHFIYTVEDGDGSPATAVLTIDVLDTAPQPVDDRAEVEEGDRDGDGVNNRVTGNVILADHNTSWDGSAGVHDQADRTSADGDLHLVGVDGDFAPGVRFVPGEELATAQGGTIVFAEDGSYTYTAPDHILHEANGQGDRIPDNEQFTCTIEDGDGSRAGAVLTVAIRAVDPSLAPEDVVTDESDGVGPAATVGGTPGAGFGTDGSADVLAVRLTGISDGDPVLDSQGRALTASGRELHFQNDSAGGWYAVAETDQVFHVGVSPDGTCTVTMMDQLDVVWQDQGKDAAQTLSFDVLVTDGDGNTAASSFDVTLDSDHVPVGTDSEVISGSDSGDPIIGNEGADTVSYASDTGGVHVDLADGAAESGGDARGDVPSGVENITGGQGNDILVGDHGTNVLHGGAGDDQLAGGGGEDVLVDGDGDDLLVGGDDADTLFGGTRDGAAGAGADTLVGDSVHDLSDTAGELYADAGGDTIVDATDPGDSTVDDLVPPPDPTV